MKIMNNKYRTIAVISALVALIYPIVHFKVKYPSIPLMNSDQAGLYFFYDYMSPMDNVIFFIYVYFVSAHIRGTLRLQNKRNKFDYFLKTRLGFKKFYARDLLYNFIESFIIYLSMEILTLFSIHVFCSKIALYNVSNFPEDYIYGANAIVSNYALNLIIYIPLSALGFSLYSLFIYSVSFFVKNIFAYRAIGIIVGMLLTVLPTMINFALPALSIIWSIPLLPNILSIGTAFFGAYNLPLSCLVHYFITYFFYVICTGILWIKGMKNEYETE